ncbi:putative tubulin binding cofactor C [Hamiltosporidium magnivora]|uniref:Putative tubulin binding cofactor C n=1 Tax=Hamiltosporidium magnivora TaxID=148818 RepID=A0A4Q9LNA3_9MICR|nr:putative tubulin binding cofactor C [Hamiltosporidium magnivora]
MEENKFNEYLNSGDSENCKLLIQKLETKLLNEKVEYSRKILKEKILKFKTSYKSLSKEIEICLEKNKREFFKIENNFQNKLNNKIYISSLKDLEYQINNCEEVCIENCENVEFTFFRVKGSIFIKNCINCKFKCISHQIRLYRCVRIYLKIYVTTGVFIEESQDICTEQLFVQGMETKNNLYNRIFDFSNPI